MLTLLSPHTSTQYQGDFLLAGLFVDSVIEVAKKELRWECDYVREVECTKRFRELIKPYPEFYVPEVIPELCTPQVPKRGESCLWLTLIFAYISLS